MLNHGQPAIVGVLGKFGLVFSDMGKINLLVFFCIGINRNTGKR